MGQSSVDQGPVPVRIRWVLLGKPGLRQPMMSPLRRLLFDDRIAAGREWARQMRVQEDMARRNANVIYVQLPAALLE
jgi:hypothetical protein